MSIPTPPQEIEPHTALVHLPPKRPLSTPSPEPEARRNIIKRSRLNVTHPPNNKGLRGKKTPSEISHDAALFWRTIASLTTLAPSSGKAHRVQLHQYFLSSYFSPPILASHRQYFQTFYWNPPASPALSASRDALCLIHLGSRYRDPRLVHEGQKRHLAAIHFLRNDLEAGRGEADGNDAVLGANYTLGQTEVFLAVAGRGSQYLAHMAGLQALLRKRGPSGVRSAFAKALVGNFRPVCLMHALLERRGTFLAEGGWKGAGKGLGEVLGDVLVDLSLGIPGLLERSDGLVQAREGGNEDGNGEKGGGGGAGEREIVELLTELSEGENGIQNWLLKFYQCTQSELETSPYRLTSLAKNYPFLHAACKGTDDDLASVFPSALTFPTFVSATTHVWVWTCLLILRETIRDVAAMHPYPTVRARDQDSVLARGVDECAVNLCQSIAYLIQPEHASCGILACSPALCFSARWFERQGEIRRAKWVEHVKAFLQKAVLLGRGYDTSINLHRPMFLWWMLPDIAVEPEDAAAAVDEAPKVVEVNDNFHG